MENESRSHGHRRHASSVTLSRKHTSELHGFAPKQPCYDDIFSDPLRFGAPPRFSSRVEDYHEIFNSSRASRGSSIPVLDLPAVRESEAPVRPRSSQLDYSKIFQGFADSNFASTYDQLFPDSNPKELDTSSDDAWTLGETESLSEDSDSNSFEACHEAIGAKKQFNMSYHRTNQRSRDGINGTTHIAQLHVVPGFTRVVDQKIPLEMTNGSKLVPPKISVATPNMNMSGELLDRKVGKKDEEAAQQRDNKSNAASPNISSNINFSGEIVNRKHCKKNEEIAQQRTKESKATSPMISANINTSGEIGNRKVGKKDGETAQQRTEESKSAPPKISVATSNPNSSGEIANRKVGKKDEETAQQWTSENKAAPPKITPDMNTSGEIINRKVCKKDEESAQQRTNENKAAPTKRSPDMHTSGELVNRTVGKKGEETAQQRTNERKATPPKIISDTNASGEIINRKVGKKDEESAQQRTNESKAAPPKISPGTNTSGEIVNRKAGKIEEETSQQRTNESEAEPKISPDLNIGGKIVNRKVGKNKEETAQQRTNETEAAPKISPDLNAGGDIVNRKVGKKVEETPQQSTDESKTVHPKISVAATNISISGEMLNKKDVNIAASHMQNYRSNRSASEGDLKFQSVTCGSGPYQNNTLFNAQDASPKNSKTDFNKSNVTKTEGSGTDASKDASWSPSLSDEELDVGSDAVASLVAVRRAIADAQARIRIAKEAMKRKEEAFGSSFKCMSKDKLKSKQKREVEISHDVRVVNEENPCGKCERVDIAKDRSIGLERENRRKMDSVSPSFDDEEFFDAKEAPEEINDKVSESFPENHCWDGAGGEVAVKQFHKLANSSRQKTVTLDPQQGGTKNKMESIEDYGQKENETTEKIFEQPVGTTRNMKAPMEAQEQGEAKRPTATKKWEEQAPSSNPFCGIREDMQVEQNVRIFSNKEEHEENQKVIHRQDNVDRLKISHERLNVNEFEAQAWEENEIESREWVTIVKNLEIAHEEEIKMGSEVSSEFEEHENEDKEKLTEACEWREECEEQQEITHSKECWEANYSYEREDTGRNSDDFLRHDFDERRLSDASIGEGSDETPNEDYVSEKSVKLKEPRKDEDNGEIPEGIYVFVEKDERLNEKAPEWVDMYEKRKGTCQIEENKIVSSSDIDEHGNEINADQEDFEHEETLKANNASHRDEIMNQCQNQELRYERDGVQGEEAQDEVGRIVEIIKDSGEVEICEEVEVYFPNGMNEKEMFERISEVPLSDGIDIGDINVNFDCKQIFWNNCIHSPSACDLKQRVEALGHEVEDGVEDAKGAEVSLNNGMEDLMQHVEALVHEAEDNLEDAKEAEVPLHHMVEDRRQHVEELIHEVKDDLGDFEEAEVPLQHIVEDRRQHVEELIHEVKDELGDFEEAGVALDHKVDDLKQHVNTSVHELEDDKEAEDAFNHKVNDHEVEDLKQHVEAVVPEAEDDVEVVKEAEVPLHHKVEDLRQHVEAVVHEAENDLENAKEAEVALNHKGDTNYFKEVDAEGIENGKNTDPTHMFVSENESIEKAEAIKSYQNTGSGEMDLDETTVTIEMETPPIRQKEVELNKPHLMAKDEEKVREREIEREKDRIAVERAIREARERAFADARERAERAAVEKATSEARERVKAKAQERIEKASAEAKFVSEKAATEAKLRAERAAVERATAEARERALKKALSEKASFNAREHAERFSGVTRENGIKQRSSSLDPRSQSSGPSSSSKYSNSLNHGIPHTTERFDGARGESAQRCQAKLERHQRTVERAAKALAEKNMRDLIAQKEQAERNRLAESLDAEVKRWSAGKHGKLRALLSTLQYILGSDSGWQPVTLNEILNPDAAKKAYRKAALYVHPDKLQQRGATIQQKYICEKVFDLLQDAWNKFNSEER